LQVFLHTHVHIHVKRELQVSVHIDRPLCTCAPRLLTCIWKETCRYRNACEKRPIVLFWHAYGKRPVKIDMNMKETCSSLMTCIYSKRPIVHVRNVYEKRPAVHLWHVYEKRPMNLLIHVQSIEFGVSFRQSQNPIDDRVIHISFATFRWKETSLLPRSVEKRPLRLRVED